MNNCRKKMRQLDICLCFLFIIFAKISLILLWMKKDTPGKVDFKHSNEFIACQIVIIQSLEANTYTAKAPQENTLFVHQMNLYTDVALPQAKKAKTVENLQKLFEYQSLVLLGKNLYMYHIIPQNTVYFLKCQIPDQLNKIS